MNGDFLKQKIEIFCKLATETTSSDMVKVAFDTRRIDKNAYNPRRGLQNYIRSDKFIPDELSNKIKCLSKLKNVLDDIKKVHISSYEWQDSNARILLSSIDNGLRTIVKDGDISESQPALGGINYLEELLFVRYRLGFDNLSQLSENDIKQIILSKDENLSSSGII